ncbi:hypothetical protein GCM10009740_17330 [Terrabacter terrae]|uniref:Uncharacterized protein n=1 Tax=Terrabacter terrae TaxID=318434 RepID=A0ABN2U362_9MICO
MAEGLTPAAIWTSVKPEERNDAHAGDRGSAAATNTEAVKTRVVMVSERETDASLVNKDSKATSELSYSGLSRKQVSVGNSIVPPFNRYGP